VQRWREGQLTGGFLALILSAGPSPEDIPLLEELHAAASPGKDRAWAEEQLRRARARLSGAEEDE
jgi:hypothetical protein